MNQLKRFFATVFLAAFIGLVLFIARDNCIQTMTAVREVEFFFEKTRTIQAAQVAADRAMMLVEDKTRQYNDLRGSFKALAKDFTRLSVQYEDAIMKAALYEQVATFQGDYIVQLEKVLRDNQIPIPAPEPPTCPAPHSAGNSFNLQRPMIPMPNVLPRSPGGSSRRNSTEPDASGTEALPEA